MVYYKKLFTNAVVKIFLYYSMQNYRLTKSEFINITRIIWADMIFKNAIMAYIAVYFTLIIFIFMVYL